MRPTRHDYAIMKYAQLQVPPASTSNVTFGFQRIMNRMNTASKRIEDLLYSKTVQPREETLKEKSSSCQLRLRLRTSDISNVK